MGQSHHLSAEELAQYHRDGFLGPFTVFTEEEMAGIRARVEREILSGVGRETRGSIPRELHTRHLDHRLVYEICTHPAIVDRMESVLGPDLIVWVTRFFVKHPGDNEIPWHQDLHYWPIQPRITLSAWLALDAADRDNACVEVVPGSHRGELTHVDTPEEMLFHKMVEPELMPDTSGAVSVELRPGQFFFFDGGTIHRSRVNTSGRRRVGLSMRYAPTAVRIHPDYPVLLVRGEDRFGHNRRVEPPRT